MNKKLKGKVRKVFEPKYGRKLTDEEVIAIGNNLTGFIEKYARFRWRKKHERQIRK